MDHKINIAIDGHSSCGKSTIAKALAKKLGYTYIDTGAMYRGVTLYTLRHGLWNEEEPDAQMIQKHLSRIELDFLSSSKGQHLLLNGEDVESDIRGMKVSNHVSPIAALPEVRKYLVRQQQKLAEDKGVVMDGRDIGTVVIPDAELKVFVTARAEIRAQRRYKELMAKGEDVTYDEVLKNIESRDMIDSSRKVSPLKMATDALLLDNSEMTIDEQQRVVEKMVEDALNK